MLPSNPRPSVRLGNPPQTVSRSRTTSTSRPTRDYHVDHDSTRHVPQESTSRRLHAQRSVGTLSSQKKSASKHPLPPLPRSPQHPSSSRDASLYSGNFPSAHSASDISSSPSSSSSTSSSLFERMRRRPGGSATSLTSLDVEEPRKTGRGVWPPSREDLAAGQGDVPNGPADDQLEGVAAYGYAVWNRLAAAAGALTVNVDMSWATNITTYAGEDTPPGKDSRLTRAMKAYHLSKAREPSDLPSWLFTDQERRAVNTAMSAAEIYGNDSSSLSRETQAPPKRTTGLKDIYDTTSVENVISSTRPSRARKDLPEAPSKATDRLRALRDAKRGATTAGSSVYDRDDVDFYQKARDTASGINPSVDTSRHLRSQRTGLPARPGTVRRP